MIKGLPLLRSAVRLVPQNTIFTAKTVASVSIPPSTSVIPNYVPVSSNQVAIARNAPFAYCKLAFFPRSISINDGALPLPCLRKEISDPLVSSYNQKETPTLPFKEEITLPQLQENELLDPNTNVIQKRAARLIVIRKKKMKKHKWKKLQKKMKYVFAKKRQRRELKKEKAFQAVLLAKVKEAEKFDAEAFVASKLEIAHWERPVTHVRGRRAPDWVIRDHLQAEDEKFRINNRIEECLRFKNKS